MLTRKATGHISEDLLDKLLMALHPIDLNEDSTQFHIGYLKAQQNFRCILEHRLNAGPLPETTPDPAPVPTSGRRWWSR